MNLVIDMNLTPRWVDELSRHGHAACHWSTVGDPKARDRVIVDWAAENAYTILTNDLDFPQILAHTHGEAPSILLLRGEPLTPEARGGQLRKVLDQCAQEIAAGAIVSVEFEDRVRIRLLPLR